MNVEVLTSVANSRDFQLQIELESHPRTNMVSLYDLA